LKNTSVSAKEVTKVKGNNTVVNQDLVVVEEPLEIRIGFGKEVNRQQKSLAITMRTPGNDFELALGFLFSEGIIRSSQDYFYINYCKDGNGELSPNVLRVELQPHILLDWERFSRHFYTNSSCGICGKASIESLEGMCTNKLASSFKMKASTLHNLNDTMREAQNVFEYTGGLHAAALFNSEGELLMLREDIGRHNALDKLIGTSLIQTQIPLTQHAVFLSGRSCFELIQKALMAEISFVLSVGAPSSLAVETAENFGVTLIGFAKNNSFNIYTSPENVIY